jgi:hypothetical protein
MEFPRLSPYAQYRKKTRQHREWIVRNTTAIAHFEENLRRPNHHALFRLNESFPYTNIDSSRQFRIFELAPGTEDDALKGELVVVDLNSSGPYDALSHHWDCRLSTDEISLSNGSFKVSKSIAGALRHLRYTHTSRRLWIDSICIDQINKKEKDAQVKIMGEIYRCATSTRVWLGEASHCSGRAFSAIEMLAAGVEGPTSKVSSSQWWAHLRESGVLGLSAAERAALISLVNRGWFDRTWVLQEVALARMVVVHCGRFSCDWQLLEKLVYVIHYSIGFLALGLQPLNRLTSFAEIIRPFQGKTQTLWDLLESTHCHDTSNPLDKVYALLGLASDAEDFLHLVDYDKHPETLFSEVFAHYLSAERPGILNTAGDAAWHVHKTMPTWAKDWCMSHSSSNFFRSGRNHEKFALDGLRPTVSDDGKILRIRGFVVDQVSFIRGSAISIYHRTSCRYLRRWETVALEHEKYPTGQASIDAFVQTLVAGASHDLSMFENSHDFVAALYRWLRDGSIKRNQTEWSDTDIILYRFWQNMAMVCHDKTFFKTHSGFIGLGSFFLRPGDLIVELQNGTTPFAIRPAANGCYTLVGDAYMHGIMEGPVEIAGRKILEFSLI